MEPFRTSRLRRRVWPSLPHAEEGRGEGGDQSKALKNDPHPALRATPEKREKGILASESLTQAASWPQVRRSDSSRFVSKLEERRS